MESVDSQDPSALFNHANQLRVNGHLQDAIHTYRQVIKLDPHHARAYANMAECLISLKQFDLALAMFQAALAL